MGVAAHLVFEAAQAYGHALDDVQLLFREQLLREHKGAWLGQAQGLRSRRPRRQQWPTAFGAFSRSGR